MLADNLGYFIGSEVPVTIVGDSALIRHPWTDYQKDDLFLEISKRCHGHSKKPRVKLTAPGQGRRRNCSPAAKGL
eukprot:12406220-Karenia_brevis.AAC.1